MRYYLSNISMIYMQMMQEAITESGRTDIFIDKDPMPDPNGTNTSYSKHREQLKGLYFSIYVTGGRSDLSDFWSVYDRIKKTNKWQVYLKLTDNDNQLHL